MSLCALCVCVCVCTCMCVGACVIDIAIFIILTIIYTGDMIFSIIAIANHVNM